jgi:hypothetical protein
MLEVKYNDETFHFEMEDCTTDQLIKIQRLYPDMTIMGLGRGMREGDIRALTCVYWLMQVQKGNDLVRLETVTLDKPVRFAGAIMVGLIKEQQELNAAAEKAIAEARKTDPKG